MYKLILYKLFTGNQIDSSSSTCNNINKSEKQLKKVLTMDKSAILRQFQKITLIEDCKQIFHDQKVIQI